MTIHLPEDLVTALRSLVQGGVFATLDDALAEAARRMVQEQDAESKGADDSGVAKVNGRSAPETAFEVMERAGLIGCLKGRPGTPSDLATNPVHREGFGGE